MSLQVGLHKEVYEIILDLPSEYWLKTFQAGLIHLPLSTTFLDFKLSKKVIKTSLKCL